MSKNKKNKANNEIMKVTFIFVGLFFVVMAYFLNFQIFESRDAINNTYNKRQDTFTKKVVRGSIYSNNGEILAQTNVDDQGNERREYPYGNAFAHVVGISSHGKSGLESLFNFNLLTSNADVIERIFNEFRDEKNMGDNIITNLDAKLQQSAYNALGNNKGAVVAIDPKSGKVLSIVSKPDFNPNEVDAIWDSLISDSNETALLNRASQGLYPPGSTFKIITLLEYIRENPDYNEYSYNCNGQFTLGEHSIKCFNGNRHGNVNLIESFAKSCNSSFVNMGLSLDMTSFAQLNQSLLFNSSLPLSLPYKKSSFKLNKNSDEFSIMQTSIGQGETLVTPIHLAMLASAIANDGVLMSPYLVDYTESYKGDLVQNFKDIEYGSLMTIDEANTLKEYMRSVITDGTAKKLNSSLYTAYGKTGTAQIIETDNKDHSWFVGFADNGEKEIAIAVLLESLPPNTPGAVDATKAILDSYFN